MSRGKYARKHKKQLEQRVEEQARSPLFDEIFTNSYDFTNNFKIQDINTQIQIVHLLYDILKKEEGLSPQKKGNFYAEEARYLLSKIHKLANFSYDQDIFYPLARDEKRLIRMECYGTINRRKDDELSFLFKHFRKNAQPEKYPSTAYRLMASPSWKVFHQFESFRSIEQDLRRYLQKSGLHPDALQVMTVSDFCEVIFQAYKVSESDGNAFFIPKQNCLKNKQNKNIMKYAGAEFEAMLRKREVNGKKIDERVVKSYCDMMRRYGNSDIGSLIITERNYNQRILEGLARDELINFGIDVSKLEIGMPIPQEFIDYMVDNNKAELIMARDNEGRPLSKDGLPQLEDHHNLAVMLAGRGDTIAAVNYPNNHISVDSRIHQGYLHWLGKTMKSGDGIEQISARLNAKDSKMRVMFGFDAENDVIYCDLEQSAEFKRRKMKDLKCKVNYFEMMQIRMQNEGKIIEKHNINCSRSYIHEGYRNLKEIKSTDDYNKETMRQVEKLLKKHITQRKGKNK
ncbi:MAG: hypothetical protein IJ532_04290 [Alphaproteobacteria bacterium]|nr:hypothetical protein [Alphaproteobacteria bacterium]